MFGGRKHKVTKKSTPLFRSGQQAADRDLAKYGEMYVFNFLAIARTNDPSSWYTLGYQDRATEGAS